MPSKLTPLQKAKQKSSTGDSSLELTKIIEALEQVRGEQFDAGDLIRMFLEENGFEPSDVNSKNGMYNFSYPLHIAVDENDFGMVKLLLEKRANIDSKAVPSKLTPLQKAKEKSSTGDSSLELTKIIEALEQAR